jgi:hypothetical protein
MGCSDGCLKTAISGELLGSVEIGTRDGSTFYKECLNNPDITASDCYGQHRRIKVRMHPIRVGAPLKQPADLTHTFIV